MSAVTLDYSYFNLSCYYGSSSNYWILVYIFYLSTFLSHLVSLIVYDGQNKQVDMAMGR